MNIFIYNNLFSDFKSVSPVSPLDYTPILVSVLVAVVLIVVGELYSAILTNSWLINSHFRLSSGIHLQTEHKGMALQQNQMRRWKK